jgi:Tfp pilus assembly protein PilF
MINLSVIYAHGNRRDEARTLLKRAARHFRSEATPLYMLAQMAEEDGAAQLATTYYEKALKADPLNGFAHIRFGRFLSAQGKPSLAGKHAKRATRLLPECGPCWQILGDILWKSGDLKNALASYQKSNALHPAKEVRARMIKLLYAMGETRRARAMERILELEP